MNVLPCGGTNIKIVKLVHPIVLQTYHQTLDGFFVDFVRVSYTHQERIVICVLNFKSHERFCFRKFITENSSEVSEKLVVDNKINVVAFQLQRIGVHIKLICFLCFCESSFPLGIVRVLLQVVLSNSDIRLEVGERVFDSSLSVYFHFVSNTLYFFFVRFPTLLTQTSHAVLEVNYIELCFKFALRNDLQDVVNLIGESVNSRLFINRQNTVTECFVEEGLKLSTETCQIIGHQLSDCGIACEDRVCDFALLKRCLNANRDHITSVSDILVCRLNIVIDNRPVTGHFRLAQFKTQTNLPAITVQLLNLPLDLRPQFIKVCFHIKVQLNIGVPIVVEGCFYDGSDFLARQNQFAKSVL